MTSKRIFFQPNRVKRLIYNSAIRSLILYHFTPLLETGIISTDYIDKYEISLQKQFNRLQNDIPGAFASKLQNWFKTKTSQTIFNILL